MVLQSGGQEYRLDYESGESQSDLFGGNSNWRGPSGCRSSFSSSSPWSSTTTTEARTFGSNAQPALAA